MQQLFTGGLALPTMLVWVVFFANLLNMYLFSYWMPTVLTCPGFKPETRGVLRQHVPARRHPVLPYCSDR